MNILEVYYDNMLQNNRHVTLQEVLDEKENRAEIQKALFSRKGSLVCFSLNIPGPVKEDPMFTKTFAEGERVIIQQLKWHDCPVIYKKIYNTPLGNWMVLLVEEVAKVIKELMVEVEEGDKLGRLFDIDVFDEHGNNISRKDLGIDLRTCFVCDETAVICAKKQVHTHKELMLCILKMIKEYFEQKYADIVTANVTRALLYEVLTTPKPGLVDRWNSGSHRDMDVYTFADSTSVLGPYFRECVLKGMEYSDLNPSVVLNKLRYTGKCAEQKMKWVTNGANAHKGIIFSLGVICCAIGMSYGKGREYKTENILDNVKALCVNVMTELENMEKPATHGEGLYKKYNVTGIRGEAVKGYPSVSKVGLPALKTFLEKGFTIEESGLRVLVHLMSVVEDTNILIRSNPETLIKIQKMSKELLDDEIDFNNKLRIMDAKFIKDNISPGGCADLLAITYFLYFMELSLLS